MTDDKRKEALEALERDWLNCGCMPCDNSCRDRKEIVSEIFKDVHETLEALTPQKVDVEGLKRELPEQLFGVDCLKTDEEAICKTIDHLNERGLLNGAGWEPIKTAPKDGTYILLYRPAEDGRHKDAVREGKYHRYGISDTWRVRSGGNWDIDAPTHWMPLPPPPSGEGKECAVEEAEAELDKLHPDVKRSILDYSTKIIILPADVRAVQNIEGQLKDFIRGAVSDAIAKNGKVFLADKMGKTIDSIYERSYAVLEALAEQEAEQ